MKEQDYINVSDLARVRSAIVVLRNIIPKNSTIIKEEDYYKIMSKLYSWESDLVELIKIK